VGVILLLSVGPKYLPLVLDGIVVLAVMLAVGLYQTTMSAKEKTALLVESEWKELVVKSV
jgi:hypothetical protein